MVRYSTRFPLVNIIHSLKAVSSRLMASDVIVLKTPLRRFRIVPVFVRAFVCHPCWMHSEVECDLVVDGIVLQALDIIDLHRAGQPVGLIRVAHLLWFQSVVYDFGRTRVSDKCCTQIWDWRYYFFPLSCYQPVLVCSIRWATVNRQNFCWSAVRTHASRMGWWMDRCSGKKHVQRLVLYRRLLWFPAFTFPSGNLWPESFDCS